MSNFSVSVVIPHHRDELLLVMAVQSALSQLFPPIEIIVVNDDDYPLSFDLSIYFRATSIALTVIELGRCSGGPAHPRNVAVDQAMGSYVAFLDADDFWFPNHLESFLEIWKSKPNAIVHGHQLCWGRYINFPFVQKGLSTSYRPKTTFRNLLRSGNKIFLSSVGAPRLLIQRYRFDVKLIWEDFDLWLRLAADGHTFINSKSCHTLYQIRDGSRSGTRESRRKGALQLIDKFFLGRPHLFLPLWLLRNLYF